MTAIAFLDKQAARPARPGTGRAVRPPDFTPSNLAVMDSQPAPVDRPPAVLDKY